MRDNHLDLLVLWLTLFVAGKTAAIDLPDQRSRQMAGGRRPYPSATPGDQCNPVHHASLFDTLAGPRYYPMTDQLQRRPWLCIPCREAPQQVHFS